MISSLVVDLKVALLGRGAVEKDTWEVGAGIHFIFTYINFGGILFNRLAFLMAHVNSACSDTC